MIVGIADGKDEKHEPATSGQRKGSLKGARNARMHSGVLTEPLQCAAKSSQNCGNSGRYGGKSPHEGAVLRSQYPEKAVVQLMCDGTT